MNKKKTKRTVQLAQENKTKPKKEKNELAKVTD